MIKEGRLVMRALLATTLTALLVAPASLQGQRSTPRRAPAPAQPPTQKVVPEMTCPAPLGSGVSTKRAFCDVMTGRDPAEGLLITLPPHRGPVILTFDLHNRHTYSEEQVKAHRAFARYTATIGVLTMDNTLISRAVVQSEFRTAADLVDRIAGGAGPRGIKAVAPIGTEPITITIPESETEVSILGEKLIVDRLDDSGTYAQPGRPIAVVSNVMIEFRPPRPSPAPRRPARRQQ